MKTLLKVGAGFVVGIITGAIVVGEMADKGEVILNNDEFFVKAEKDKSANWSYAKVYFKEPQ